MTLSLGCATPSNWFELVWSSLFQAGLIKPAAYVVFPCISMVKLPEIKYDTTTTRRWNFPSKVSRSQERYERRDLPLITQFSFVRRTAPWCPMWMWALRTASSILQWGFKGWSSRVGWSALFWDHGPPFQMGVPKSWVILILHPLVLLPTGSFWYPLVS